ncbi:DNA-directed RNA polymerase subunit beta [Staphylococcus sp. 17KM0847]|nr:DNA-directed RNA polymerase subunit beta [Staphylococcus sp. 17KM0847]
MIKMKRFISRDMIKASTSLKLCVFIILSIIIFGVGLMIGLMMNHDNILKILQPDFWQYVAETIGG